MFGCLVAWCCKGSPKKLSLFCNTIPLKLKASSPPCNGEKGRPYGFLLGVGGLFSVANSLGGFEEGKCSSLGMVSPPMNLWGKNLHHLKVGHVFQTFLLRQLVVFT